MTASAVDVGEPCARGCTRGGKHRPTCSCGADGHDHDEQCAACAGCLPRGAALGRLCTPCAGRVTRALLDAGDLAAWLLENVMPGSTPDAPRVSGSREAPVPLSLTALDDADELHATLATWVMRYTRWTGLAGPATTGTATRPRLIDRDGHHHTERRPTGLRPEAGATVTAQLAAWLLAHQEGLAHHEAAPFWHDEIVGIVRLANAHFPRADPARKLPIPCPSCDRVLLYMHPPVAAGHPVTVACAADECGRILTEGDYYVRATTLLHERQRPHERVDAHA